MFFEFAPIHKSRVEGFNTYAYFKKLCGEGVAPKDAVWQGFTGKMVKEALNWPRDEVEVKFSR